jgi:Cu(I)/Ag(I) efflux system membrane fusion protein
MTKTLHMMIWTARLTAIGMLVAGCRGEKGPRTPISTTSARDSSSVNGMQGMPGKSGTPAASAGGIRLTPEQIRQFGVTFDTVKMRPLVSAVRTTGTVMADETKLSAITLKVSGYVERLYVDQTGQRVRRGQPLLAVYSPDVVAAQDELLVAARLDSTAGGASTLVDAGKRRLQAWGLSDEQINNVLKTGVAEHAVTLPAPVNGVVLDKKVVQGQAIQPGDLLLSIADLSDVWLNVEIRESDATDVRVGSPATIEFSADPAQSFKGRVSFVYPTVQGDARTVTARVVIDNPDALLKPGMYATVGLETPSRPVLSVPSSALFHAGERTLAFVDLGGGSLMPREVVTGRTAGQLTQVVSGLDPGQRVVTSAQYLLDSESNLAEVMKSMIGQAGRVDSKQDMPGMEMAPARRDSDSRK